MSGFDVSRQFFKFSSVRRFITSMNMNMTMTMTQTHPRRFAPLRIRSPAEHHPDLPKLQGIIFDVDGTLCLPQNYMFTQMRAALGIPRTTDILEHIATLPTASAQEEAMESIRSIERSAMASQEPQPGLTTLMAYLQSRGVRKAICTRNFEQPVTHLLGKFLSGHSFSPIVTRDFRPPKPDPAGLLFIARSWGLVRNICNRDQHRNGPSTSPSPSTSVLLNAAAQGSRLEREGAIGPKDDDNQVQQVGDASTLIMVGDSIDDMTAGRLAGAATVLLVNKENAHLAEHPHTDLVIGSLDELIDVLEHGFVGKDLAGRVITPSSG